MGIKMNNSLETAHRHVTDPYVPLIGQRVAVYGPNFIWRGKLVSVSEYAIVLDDCYQIFETGAHQTSDCESELVGDGMIFQKSAICNCGVTKWA